jgi:hypothetical protein
MEAVYLQNNVGKELASALAALHTYGLNNHTDPSQPLKDPIAFLGNYLLEKTRVEQSILASAASREPLLAMMDTMTETTQTYTKRRKNTLTSLQRELDAREVQKEEMAKIKEAEENAAAEEEEEKTVAEEKTEEEEAVVIKQEEEPEQVEAEGEGSVVQEEAGAEETGEVEGEQNEEVAE